MHREGLKGYLKYITGYTGNVSLTITYMLEPPQDLLNTIKEIRPYVTEI